MGFEILPENTRSLPGQCGHMFRLVERSTTIGANELTVWRIGALQEEKREETRGQVGDRMDPVAMMHFGSYPLLRTPLVPFPPWTNASKGSMVTVLVFCCGFAEICPIPWFVSFYHHSTMMTCFPIWWLLLKIVTRWSLTSCI